MSIIKNIIHTNLFLIYQKMPTVIRSIISRIIFRPTLGKGVKIFGNALWGPKVSISDYSYIHGQANLANIEIGKYCSVAKNLSTIYAEHNYKCFSNYSFFMQMNSPLISFEKVNFESNLIMRKKSVIENDVWIGENVTILSGVHIGNGAVIGACSFVNKDIPDYAIAVGVPCKVIKYRFDKEDIEFLKEISWWNWEPKKIYNQFERLCKFDKTLISGMPKVDNQNITD
jgi:virginiamycin A acetyltransferase